MIAIEGIPRSMYHGHMLANHTQGFPGAPSLNGDLQRPGFFFGEQKPIGISQPSAPSTTATADEVDKSKPQQQQQQQQQKQQQQQRQPWKDALKQRKEYSTLKKVILVLQDNRLKTGDPKMAEKLRELNRSQNESCPLLKTILNLLLVSTAVVLLVAVVVVIIYTSVRSPPIQSQLTTDDRHLEQEQQEYDDNYIHDPRQQQQQQQQQQHAKQPKAEVALESSPLLPGSKESTGPMNTRGGSEFKPRTKVKPSNSNNSNSTGNNNVIRCRIIPVVTHAGSGAGARSSVDLRQLCFETSAANDTS